ncbi:MAG: DUF3806 domain-containing protein [Planctomycetes bacterium]|nr:DUF3806 domain-containing protein [Planctomycetota bacterium]
MPGQKVTELNDEQMHLLRSCIVKFMEIAEEEVPEPPEDADTSEIADMLLENWRGKQEPEFDAEAMALILGCMCCELLRSYLRVDWKCVVDEYGEAMALYGELNGETLLMFPVDSAQKRIDEPGQTLTDWVFGMLEQENVKKFLRPEGEDPKSIFED